MVNVNSGPTENRLLLTGLHVVADIYCNGCETRLGWKYVEAFEESQKYKEGKFILEKAMILKEEELRQRRAEQLVRQEAQRQRAAGKGAFCIDFLRSYVATGQRGRWSAAEAETHAADECM